MDLYLKMTKRLDAMTRGVTTKEANLLDRVLKTLADEEEPLTDKDKAAIEKMYEKYFGKDEEEEEKDDEEEADEEEEETEEPPPGSD